MVKTTTIKTTMPMMARMTFWAVVKGEMMPSCDFDVLVFARAFVARFGEFCPEFRNFAISIL